MQQVFFVVNQDLRDGSAHALYLLRHFRALARNTPPGWSFSIVLPTQPPADFSLPEIKLIILPSVRRRLLPDGRRRGWQINAVFHLAARGFLRRAAGSGDWVGSASFPRLFAQVAQPRSGGIKAPKFFYEIHQVEELSRPADHPKCRAEHQALARADLFYVTSEPLAAWAQQQFPKTATASIGLATSYHRPPSPETMTPSPLRLGYFGSISSEQGIPWLLQQWPAWRSSWRENTPAPELHLYGRARAREKLPASVPEQGIFCFPPRPAAELPSLAAGLHGLIIPALDQAHRASIAFTKVYDYIGLGLPLLAASLPTIREVLPRSDQGWFFRPGNAEELFACLSSWATQPTERHHRASQAFSRATELTWDKRATRWWQVLLQSGEQEQNSPEISLPSA